MSYLQHWNLQRSPFSIRGNKRGIYVGGSVEEALARSEFLIDHRKQFGLLIGPRGVGKTTVLDHLAWKRNVRNPREFVVRIDLGGSDAQSIASCVLGALGQEGRHAEAEAWTCTMDHLFSLAAMGHRAVLLLDNLQIDDEYYLRVLSKLWGNQNEWCTLLSVDDETLVNLPSWVLERSELKIELPAWDLGQTADYFEFALSQENANPETFDAQSITRIQELADGIPRKIGHIAELTLVAGAVRKAKRITSELVDQVCEEFLVTLGPKFPTFWDEQTLNAG
jgi:type II secretory pathway predicted ATPase ExeA